MPRCTYGGIWNVLIGLLFGFVLGGLVTAGVVGWTYPRPQQSGITRFGDVDIYVLSTKDEEGKPIEELMMKRDGRGFFSLVKSSSGKVAHLAVAADGRDNIRFVVSVSPQSGQWANATYGGTRAGALIPQQFEDIDFDGTFDLLDVVLGPQAG